MSSATLHQHSHCHTIYNPFVLSSWYIYCCSYRFCIKIAAKPSILAIKYCPSLQSYFLTISPLSTYNSINNHPYSCSYRLSIFSTSIFSLSISSIAIFTVHSPAQSISISLFNSCATAERWNQICLSTQLSLFPIIQVSMAKPNQIL